MTGRVGVGIDPGTTHPSGVCVWAVRGGLVAAQAVKIDAASWSEAKSIALLDELLGDAEWIAAIEKPWGNRKGGGRAPIYASTHWNRVVLEVARRRAERAGVRYRKPIVLMPTPGEWRAPLGIASSAPRGMAGTYDDRRRWLKQRAIDRLWSVHRLTIEQPDIAEAACIADWIANRIALLPEIPRRRRANEPTRFAA